MADETSDIVKRLHNANPFNYIGTLASDAIRVISKAELELEEIKAENASLLEQKEFYRRAYESDIACVEQARKLFERESKKCYQLEKLVEKLREEMEAKDGQAAPE